MNYYKNIEYLKQNNIDVESSLELLGDQEIYDETLNDFLEESERRLPKIEEYKNNKDMENYAILVHAMKGDSKYLGFNKLADLSYDHQLKSQAGDYDYVVLHYDELMEEVNRVISVVNSYLNS